MAIINGREKNNSALKIFEEEILEIETKGQNAEIENKTAINGKFVPTNELEKYKIIKRLSQILGFQQKDESEVIAYSGVYFPSENYQELFEIIKNNDLVGKGIRDFRFPKEFNHYGVIPNTEGIMCPRAKHDIETIESYESYLENYYKNNGNPTITVDENGIRSPYPHENYSWEGTTPQPLRRLADASEMNRYYAEYKVYMKQKLAKKPISSNSQRNNAPIAYIQEKMNTILKTGNILKDDQTVVELINGHPIPQDEKENYLFLTELYELLNVDGKEDKDLIGYTYQVRTGDAMMLDKLYVPKAKSAELFKLRKKDPYNIFEHLCPITDIESELIPGTKIEWPRPKGDILENAEEYEEFLNKHYKNFKVEAELDDDGKRKPFPHELYIHHKNTGVEIKDIKPEDCKVPSYVEYLKIYEAAKAKKATGTGSGTKTGTTDENGEKKPVQPTNDDENKKKRQQTVDDRKEKRSKLSRRIYPKDKKTFKDWITSPFRKISEADGTLANGENWPKIKRLLIGLAVAGCGIAILSTIGGPLISTVLTGLTSWPQFIAGALTGSMITESGALVALSAVDRIFLGLIGTAVPAGIIGSIVGVAKKLKKKKDQEIDDGQEPPKPSDDDDDKEKGKDKGKGKGKGKDDDKDKGSIDIPKGTVAEQKDFFIKQFAKLDKAIKDAQAEYDLLQTQNLTTEEAKKELAELSERIQKLKNLKDQYIAAFVVFVQGLNLDSATIDDDQNKKGHTM